MVMRYRRFAPLGRDLSRLVLGTAAYEHAPLDVALDLFDAFRELGGNVVDTGREYGNAEPILGRWLRERGLDRRDRRPHQGRPPRQRHRPEARQPGGDHGGPRGEPPGPRAGHRSTSTACTATTRTSPSGRSSRPCTGTGSAGRIRVLGASNWSAARLEEAAAYAARHGLDGFACSSPGLSLAAPREAPWPGCVTIHEPARRARGTRSASSRCSRGRRWPAASSPVSGAPTPLACTRAPTIASASVGRRPRRAQGGDGQPGGPRLGPPPALSHLRPHRAAKRRGAPRERRRARPRADAGGVALARPGGRRRLIQAGARRRRSAAPSVSGPEPISPRT